MRVNKIPASCTNNNCSFTFPTEVAAVVSSISPNYGGQNENIVTISGSGFTNDSSAVSVTIGNKPCTVESVQDDEIVCVPSPNKAGTYTVRVHVEGTGYAMSEDSSNPVTFQYSVEVYSIEPDSGSVGGGNNITISGVGFCEDSVFYVLIDDCLCLISSVSLTEIICQPQGHYPEVVNITVCVEENEFLIEGAYEYSFDATALISSVNPSTGPTYGGTEITISGENFGSSDDDIRVIIGMSECTVIEHTNTSITCTTSGSPPGTYNILVYTPFGIALNSGVESNSEILDYLCVDGDNSMLNISDLLYQYSYELNVTCLSPCSGSILGGTTITILGTGFANDTRVVDQNGVECIVENVSDNEIQCVTTSLSRTHIIDNSGEHDGKVAQVLL